MSNGNGVTATVSQVAENVKESAASLGDAIAATAEIGRAHV